MKGSREPVKAKTVIITAGIGLALGLGTWAAQGGFQAQDGEAVWRTLCDALTVPGVLLTGAGLMGVVSGLGAFDGLGFTTRKAFGQILSEEKRAAMPKTYYDYVRVREEKRGKKPRVTLWVGLIFLALAAAALGIWSAAAG